MTDESGPENSPDDKGYFTAATDPDTGKKTPAKILTPGEASKEHHDRDSGRPPRSKKNRYFTPQSTK